MSDPYRPVPASFPRSVGGSNKIAIAGFVLSLVGHALAILIPNMWYVLFLAFIPGLLALIFGIIGYTTANRMGGSNRGFAVWAIVLSVTPIVTWFLFTFIYAAVLGTSRG